MWPWRRRSNEDFAEEISAHISAETMRLVDEEGLSFQDAKAQALRSFGNVTHARERFYDRRTMTWLDDLRRDTSYSLRSLRRNPGFAAVAILTLAIGIGATTTIYSVVDAILLQPLPFRDSDRLVTIAENIAGRRGTGFAGRIFQRGVTYNDFVEWRSRTQTLSDVIAFNLGPVLVRTSDGIRQLHGGTISGNAFHVLAAQAMAGRTLVEDDERRPDVILLGFDAWRRVFQSDPAIVGKRVQLGNRTLVTVVGVLPDGFEFPTRSLDFYRPLALSSKASNLTLIGLIRPGVSLQAARDEANALGTAIRPPPEADRAPLRITRFDVQRLKDEVVRDLQPALRLLLVAVAVVLMIVCANVANLLLARSTVRRREIAVRVAIGAGRGRIIRQVLAECLVLAGAGGILGALVGAAGVSIVKRLATIDAPGIFRQMFGSTILPRTSEVNVNLNVFAIAFGLSALACLVFGLLPAWRMSRVDHADAMSTRTGASPRRDTRIRSTLVVGQVVMATMLLVGAGLLIKSFITLTTIDKGYDATNVLAVQLLFPGDHPIQRRAETIDALLSRLRSYPEIQFAGFTRAGVLIGEEIEIGTFVPAGRTVNEIRAAETHPRVRSITQGFLPAMGIRFLAGRDLDDSAGVAQPEIVINRSASTLLFGRREPVGELVDWNLDTFQLQVRVVGVVQDLRNETLEHEPVPEIFIDYHQLWNVSARAGESAIWQNQTALGVLSLAIRTRSDPQHLIPPVAQMVRAVDPVVGIDAIAPLDDLVSSSVARRRFYALILGIFAGVAVILAAVGLYGVLAYVVAQRTQEIGIRMALGAHWREVLTLVLRKGVMLTATGIFLGLVASAAGTRVLEGMLFGVTPLDPATFVIVSVAFGVLALFASYVPARRATRIDPLTALRTE
jgi:predicted permease